MQKLPFLVTQPGSLKRSAPTSLDQKTTESGSLFKHVLSKQVEQDAPKEKTQLHGNTQKYPATSKQVQSNTFKAADGVEPNDGKNTPDDMTDILAGLEQKPIKSGKHKGLADETQHEDAVLDQATNTPAMLIQQIVNASPQAKVVSMDNNAFLPTQEAVGNVDTLTTRQISFGTATPIGKEQKAVSDGISTDNLLAQQAVDTQPNIRESDNHQGMDNAQSFSAKLSESTEQLAEKWLNKPDQVSSVKMMQESVATSATSMVPTALQNALQLNAAQMQTGRSNVIDVYPGKSGWDQAISQKVVWMVGAAEQSATLTLNPPDLGPLQVVISVSNEKADTTFISENPDVRKALEDGIPALRDLMSQAGVQLGQANVSTGKQQQESQQAEKERHSNSGFVSTNREAEPPQVSHVRTQVQNGLVDTFA